MPTYTYTCTACNEMIEKRQSFSDPPLSTCEQCGGALRKVIHPVGIVFKGSGWYITDSRSSSSSTNGRSSSSTSDSTKSSEGSSESKESSGAKESAKANAKDSTASSTPSASSAASTSKSDSS